jgi:hypothetical protein
MTNDKSTARPMIHRGSACVAGGAVIAAAVMCAYTK